MVVYEKILIPYDGSKGSKTAARHALELAADQGAEVAGLKVISYVGEVISPSDSLWDTIGEDLQTKAREILSGLESLAEEEGMSLDLEVREGSAEAEIVDFAEEWGADLIVMGRHGRGRVGKFLMGSTVSRVLQTAPCPVLVLR